MRNMPSTRPDDLEPIYQELMEYSEKMKSLHRMDFDEARGWISGTSARVLELTYRSLRQPNSRAQQMLRLEWLIPMRDELDRQWKVVSRSLTNRQSEWDMTRGGV